MKMTATCGIQKFRRREKIKHLSKTLGGRQHRTTPGGQILGVATPTTPAALTPNGCTAEGPRDALLTAYV